MMDHIVYFFGTYLESKQFVNLQPVYIIKLVILTVLR